MLIDDACSKVTVGDADRVTGGATGDCANSGTRVVTKPGDIMVPECAGCQDRNYEDNLHFSNPAQGDAAAGPWGDDNCQDSREM